MQNVKCGKLGLGLKFMAERQQLSKKLSKKLKKDLHFSWGCSTIAIVDGPLVKRLRRCPLTAETGVRFPYGLLRI